MNAYAANRFARIITPPPRLTISEWAMRYGQVPFAPERGKYQITRMPWQRDMLNDPLNTQASEIVWQMATRMGKSICVCLIIEYFIHQVPSEILVKYPIIEAGKRWLKKQLLPMVAFTPCMRGLLRETRSKDSDSTMMDRAFPGGDLTVIGANSPSGLRSMNKRIILQEEIDADETSSEGDAVALADGRAENFYNAVKLKTSTPHLTGESRINEIFLRSDQRYFFVPCAHCSAYFAPKRDNLRFSFATNLPNPDGSPRGPGGIRDTPNARLVCPHCEWELTDAERMAMVTDSTAHWKATAPFTGVLGRHLNAMYRVMGKKPAYKTYLHQFSEMWLDAKHGGQETIRVFVNNFDANTYEADSEKIDWKPLKERSENYGPDLPEKCVFLLAGVDIHPDRVEIQVVGWGDEEEVWAIDYEVITGDFDMPDCQDLVASFLNGKRYEHPILGPLTIFAKYLDCGKQTKVQAVYRFCKKYNGQNCRAVKGFGSPLGAIYTTATERRFAITRYNINVDHFKNMISDRLRNTDHGPRFIHFPKEEISYPKNGVMVTEKTRFTSKYYSQLCSEKKVSKRTPTGGITTEWVKHKSNTRNEAWDTMIYAFAGWETIRPATMIKQTWEKVLKVLKERRAGMEPEIPKVTEYIIKPPTEAKAPELRQLPATRGGGGKRLAPRPSRPPPPFRGGMFNPLKI